MLYKVSFQLREAIPGGEELLAEILSGLGIPAQDLTQETRNGKTALLVFMNGKRRMTGFKRRFARSGIKGVAIRTRRLKDKDWLTRWKKYFRPFNFTRRLRLIPYGQKDRPVKNGRRTIYIDTATAFGSGLHSTTQLVARLIEENRGKFRSFLDIGTGSGILAVTAAASGAKRIEAIDCDRQVLATAKKNFRLNGITGISLKARGIARYHPKTKFEFVSANLITDDLLKEKRAIIGCVKPGCYLAVSGITQENLRRFRSCFPLPGLKCVKVLTKKGWAALLYRKAG